MAQFTSAGYQDIRDYVEANWSFIEIRNASAAGVGGAAVVRLNVSDPRVTITESGGTIQYQVVLTGSDADITPAVTLRSSAIYDVASGGSAHSEEVFAEGDASINADPDAVTITHTLEIPNQA